jgi:8-amino-7-oxononanoate synthase
MLDFTSALYLGLCHPSGTLRPWARLTTGRPAALQAPPGTEGVTASFVHLLGCARATLGTSTLHIFWDVFQVLAMEPIGIYMDAGAYPIVRWGIERVSAQGVPTANFPRHDPAALADLLRRHARFNRRPVVVTDGLCPATGRTAPVVEYLNLVRARGGYLVIDDTQALGILGRHSGPDAPYGRGGGGTPAWHDIQAPELIVGSSLAKGFGVPLAVLAGSQCVIARFENNSATRMHCSPPAVALIHAAAQALQVNASGGERLRWRLAQLVRRFRERLRQVGFVASGGLFPVQTLHPIAAIDAAKLHSLLQRAGVETVLHRAHNGRAARISFLLTASHRLEDIDRAIALLANIVAQQRPRQRSKVGHHAYTTQFHARAIRSPR